MSQCNNLELFSAKLLYIRTLIFLQLMFGDYNVHVYFFCKLKHYITYNSTLPIAVSSSFCAWPRQSLISMSLEIGWGNFLWNVSTHVLEQVAVAALPSTDTGRYDTYDIFRNVQEEHFWLNKFH